MQDFDSVIRELIEKGTITLEDGLTFATNPNNLLLSLKGVTASEEFMQRESKSLPLTALSNRGSMLSLID
jgi:Tfp pilus assembly ATPase PilU